MTDDTQRVATADLKRVLRNTEQAYRAALAARIAGLERRVLKLEAEVRELKGDL